MPCAFVMCAAWASGAVPACSGADMGSDMVATVSATRERSSAIASIIAGGEDGLTRGVVVVVVVVTGRDSFDFISVMILFHCDTGNVRVRTWARVNSGFTETGGTTACSSGVRTTDGVGIDDVRCDTTRLGASSTGTDCVGVDEDEILCVCDCCREFVAFRRLACLVDFRVPFASGAVPVSEPERAVAFGTTGATVSTGDISVSSNSMESPVGALTRGQTVGLKCMGVFFFFFV